MANPAVELSQEAHLPANRGLAIVETSDEFKHTWRIWCIFLVLCLLAFMSALDSTIITTSLPTITRDIGGTSDYVWVANSYLFAATVPQPLYGQIANIFGRRNPLLIAIVLFFVGSGIAAGLYVLPEIILCDLIPPRYRGPFLSALLSTAALGTTIGPIIGGALAQVSWRWIFWINLPVSGVLSVALIFLLRVKYIRSPTWIAALSRVDFVGNAIFLPSMVALFFGLIMGGNDTAGFPWSSSRVIIPLVLGILGWAAYHFYEASSMCREPSTPPRLFKHRTSIIGFLMIFLAAIILQAIGYFLPIYFQAIKGTSPLLSGVYYLPFSIALIPLAGMAGGFLSKTGQYRPVHWAGFALSAIGVGLFSMLNEHSSTGAWIGFQIIAAGGSGFIFTVSLPSTLAPLLESDVAVATSTYAFVRSLGLVWGVTMSSVVFNNQINAHINKITDESIRLRLVDGAAYTYAAGAIDEPGSLGTLPEPTKSQVISVYVQAMRTLWLVFVGVAALGFFAAFMEKHVQLRKDHSSDFGLVDKQKNRNADNTVERELVIARGSEA